MSEALLPDAGFMIIRRKQKQSATNQIEKQPGKKKSRHSLGENVKRAKPIAHGKWDLGHLSQAQCAQSSPFVLRHAFTAEKAMAFGASGDGLAQGVVETTLLR